MMIKNLSFFMFLGLICSSVINAEVILSKSDAEKNVGSTEFCRLELDSSTVIDATYSFTVDLPSVKSELLEGISSVMEEAPGSRFSIGFFQDKPIFPLGWPRAGGTAQKHWFDRCYQMLVGFTDNKEEIETAVQSISPGGGYNFRENQLGAMLRSILTGKSLWREEADIHVNKDFVKVVVVVTDSYSHEEGDADAALSYWNEYYGEEEGIRTEFPKSPLGFDNEFIYENEDNKCHFYDYPSLQTVAAVLKRENVIPIFLVSTSLYNCETVEDGKCVYPDISLYARRQKDQTFADPEVGMAAYYKQLLQRMDVSGIVEPLSSGYQHVAEKLESMLTQLKKIPGVCREEYPQPTPTVSSSETTESPSSESSDPTETPSNDSSDPTETPSNDSSDPTVCPEGCVPGGNCNCEVEVGVNIVVKVGGETKDVEEFALE